MEAIESEQPSWTFSFSAVPFLRLLDHICCLLNSSYCTSSPRSLSGGSDATIPCWRPRVILNNPECPDSLVVFQQWGIPFLRFGSDDAQYQHNQPPSPSRTQLIISYSLDWVVTLVLVAAFFALNKVDGFKREFSLSDTTIQYPFTEHERVPDKALYFIAIVAPLVLQWVINVLTIRTWWDAHSSALGVILSLAISGSVTQFVRITVGRPRPDFIVRCNPAPGTVDPPLGHSSASICNQSDISILREGFRSFPSGHASLSFAGLGFLSLYVAGKMHLFDGRGHTLKVWIALAPVSGAALVTISRSMDYRHHWEDLLVGAILGVSTACLAYRQYYPPLNSEFSHRPYPPRSRRADDVLPVHANRPPFAGGIYSGVDIGEDVELNATVRKGLVDRDTSAR
ncbi:PAP2-domain-containing protein [Dentipellis sp. KUC8613]|nr:PAP2-domain-containing protein [Dentipellis sp. KUC8613]